MNPNGDKPSHSHTGVYAQYGYDHLPQANNHAPRTNTRTVVMSQPGPMVITPISRPNDYMILSVISCCFCWPMAICAIVSSSGSKTAADAGNIKEAESKGRTARNIAIAAILIGIVLGVVVFRLRLAQSGGTTTSSCPDGGEYC